MNRPIEIYLLDDDPVFLRTFSRALEQFLSRQSHPFHLSAFTDGSTLLTQAGSARQLDLLISDIDLNTEATSGLMVAQQLRRRFPDCSIIYLTAFLEFATEIYDTRPLYFILKEEYMHRIPAAMQIFFRDYTARQDILSVTSGRDRCVLRLRDLIYCERVGRKTNLVCTDRQLLVPDPISELMDKLPANRFIICHQGYIVGLAYVESYRRYLISLSTGRELPISRARYDAFQKAFAAYLAD